MEQRALQRIGGDGGEHAAMHGAPADLGLKVFSA
jgi:hypothetical protein